MKGQFKYAGFGIRFIAYTIDIILYFLLTFILSRILFSTSLSLLKIEVWNLVIGLIIYSVYEIYLTYRYGGTVGKILMKCPVVDDKGNYITLSQSVIRYFSKFVSTLILGIGYLMIIWDSKKQGLHDKFAKTYVAKDYKININKKLKKTIFVVISIVVILAIIYYLIYFVSLVLLQLNITSSSFDANKPKESVDSYCETKPFWIRGDCIIEIVESEPIFEVMDVASRLEICSDIKTKKKHSECILNIAITKNNETLCEHSRSSYLSKQCLKGYDLIVNLVDYVEERFEDSFSGELGRGEISIGVYISGKCKIKDNTEFYQDQTLCYIYDGFSGFVEGNDGLHRFSAREMVKDSDGTFITSSKDLFAKTGIGKLDNGTFHNRILNLNLKSLKIGNYTNEISVYDKISNKGITINKSFSVIGERNMLMMENFIFGVEEGDKCVPVAGNIFDKLDAICYEPVKVTGFEPAENGLYDIRVSSKTLNDNGTVEGYLEYNYNKYQNKYVFLEDGIFTGIKFTFFFNTEGHYIEETTITDEISGKTVQATNEFTIVKEPNETLNATKVNLGYYEPYSPGSIRGECIPQRTNTFYRQDSVCIDFVKIEGFEVGDDGLHWFDADAELINSEGKILDRDRQLFDEEGHFFLSDSAIYSHFAWYPLTEIAPGSYTYKVTFYDRVSKKRVVEEKDFVII